MKNGKARRVERGYYPYMIRFIDDLERYRLKSSLIDDQIKAYGEEEWHTLWLSKIEPKKSLYALQLGGYHPSHPKPEVKEEEPEEDDRFSSFNK